MFDEKSLTLIDLTCEQFDASKASKLPKLKHTINCSSS
jgi:hypothetical protein